MLTENFEQPNPEDSFRSLAEQVLEDVLVGGFGAIEIELAGDDERPSELWPVDGARIRIRTDWDGDPARRAMCSRRAYSSSGTDDPLNDEELSYIRLNPRTHTPFGLGRLEVAFETIHGSWARIVMRARLASNSVVQYALWLQNLTPAASRAADSLVAGRDRGHGQGADSVGGEEAGGAAVRRRHGCRPAAAMAGVPDSNHCGCVRSAADAAGVGARRESNRRHAEL